MNLKEMYQKGKQYGAGAFQAYCDTRGIHKEDVDSVEMAEFAMGAIETLLVATYGTLDKVGQRSHEPDLPHAWIQELFVRVSECMKEVTGLRVDFQVMSVDRPADQSEDSP